MSTAFESWYTHETHEYRICIYVSRGYDENDLKQGNLEPGRIEDFQMHFERIFHGEVVREFDDRNALRAGEWLRDELGYGPAKDLLTFLKVPSDILLWKLGEKG